MNRRDFLKAGSLVVPAFIVSPQARPQFSDGIQIGDPLADRAIVWARTDRPARLIVEYAAAEDPRNARRVRGPEASAASDFTVRMDLRNLPAGQTITLRVWFEDTDGRADSERAAGAFRTAPADRRSIRFLWSADTAGQGYGINPDLGGMKIYETMRGLNPDFFIHCGDTIYADSPIPSEIRLPDGSTWRNLTTEAKSKVAETLDEFRGCYRYNLMDDNIRRFNAEVPQVWQWDDHEVTNNWSAGKDLSGDNRYKEKNIRVLAERARQAFFEYAPLRFEPRAPRIYRRIPYGPLLDVFVLDLRSYRAANSYNLQPKEDPGTAFFGADQMRWLEEELKDSRAVWKVIASDMPIGVIVSDGRDPENRPRFENAANGNGPALGRELEIARLLSFLKKNAIRNVVWLTGDVHYTAAHYYDPGKARFTDFDAFWEFVSGPLNAGTFGPNATDDTFGIQVVFQKTPGDLKSDNSPRAGLQFFGEVVIDGRSEMLTANLRDLSGATLFSRTLTPEGSR